MGVAQSHPGFELGGYRAGVGGQAALEAIGRAGVDGALLGGTIQGGVGSVERGLDGLGIAGGDGFAHTADGAAGERAAGAVSVALAKGLVPPLDSGLMVSHVYL